MSRSAIVLRAIRALFLPSALILANAAPLHAGQEATDLRCEWRVNPPDVADPCPEFYWRAPSQSACRVVVARTETELLKGEALVWDSGRLETPLPIVEYAGPELANGAAYWWRVQTWNAEGGGAAASAPQTFRMNVRTMPHHLPSIRAFMNFGGAPEFARDWLDLSFRQEGDSLRKGVLTTHYALVATMVLPHPSSGTPPSGKAKALADYCVAKGLTREGIQEEMFCHFAEDTYVSLHVGAELASNPRQQRLCPGWDPANDRNGDGLVDVKEAARPANPKATARAAKQARIPIFYWGPPTDDFVMNVGHPHYQEFMATVWARSLCDGYDGIYFDTVPPDVAGVGAGSRVLEYPRRGRDRDQWMRDLQVLFARIKIAVPDKVVLANEWDARPMVCDGWQSEGWQSIGYQLGNWRRRLDMAIEHDRRGKIHLIQYNPVFHPTIAQFGAKLPVNADRDKMFGLATYLLAHGRFTYFGFGGHPYEHVTRLSFPAMRADLGEPDGSYYVMASGGSATEDAATNLLPQGGFEEAGDAGNPAGWLAAEPVERDTTVKRSGTASVRIRSESRGVNNINMAHLRLRPNTSYTLIAWARTDSVSGSPGAEVYPYGFEEAGAENMMTWTGTEDWTEQRVVIHTRESAEGRINFRLFGATGTVWFDDLRLIKGMHVPWQVFARKYTKGLVLVKPYSGGTFGDDTATRHRLPGRFRLLHPDGSAGEPTEEVTLRNGEAAVLLKLPASALRGREGRPDGVCG